MLTKGLIRHSVQLYSISWYWEEHISRPNTPLSEQSSTPVSSTWLSASLEYSLLRTFTVSPSKSTDQLAVRLSSSFTSIRVTHSQIGNEWKRLSTPTGRAGSTSCRRFREQPCPFLSHWNNYPFLIIFLGLLTLFRRSCQPPQLFVFDAKAQARVLSHR